MAKLTEKEREGFEKILAADLAAINDRFMNQIKDFWGIARIEVLKANGWDKLILEKQSLELQQAEIKSRIHEIEGIINSKELQPEQVAELGGNANEYGRFTGASFYGIPVTSQFEYDIVEYIRKYINLEVPTKVLRDIGRASIRALAMAGTFEEAREAYQKFYSMDFRKYGVDIPPRLDEIQKDKRLITAATEPLKQIEGNINEET